MKVKLISTLPDIRTFQKGIPIPAFANLTEARAFEPGQFLEVYVTPEQIVDTSVREIRDGRSVNVTLYFIQKDGIL
ncbi:hypothetical protein D3C74_50090 [compost metagenome]